MKRLAILLTLFAAAANAQSFTFGPRVSSYSTEFDGGISTLKTGRQTGYGLMGDYRNGAFVLDYSYDHDPQNGASVVDLLIDTGDYTRDRGEATVGFAVLPGLDLQGGLRYETFRIGGVSIIGTPLFTDVDANHQSLVFGVKLHTPANRPVGLYGLARGYVGNMKIDDRNFESNTTGYRFEGGVTIPIGQSSWSVVPGVEWEHIKTEDFGLSFDSNRFLLGFVYRGGGR